MIFSTINQLSQNVNNNEDQVLANASIFSFYIPKKILPLENLRLLKEQKQQGDMRNKM